MTLGPANWNYPTAIRFGIGRVAELPDALAVLGISRPLVVTDEVLADLPLVANVVTLLQEAGVPATLFNGVQGNPTGTNVANGVASFTAGNHDGVVALGGGSALDAAKCIALTANQAGDLWAFEDRDHVPALANAKSPQPVVAIPTTAGTGSEVGRAAVILNEAEQRKCIIFHPQMMPDIVILDPQLTVGLPANITAWTGIDAMVHAVEAYLAPGFHPMAEGIAIEAIRLVARWLPLAVADGADLEARGNMLVAASMGATAFQKGLGSVHSISHVLGALYNTHHGLANAVVLPFGLLQNSDVCTEKLAYLAKVLDLAQPRATAFIDFIFALREQLDVPSNLQTLGIDAERAEDIGRLAYADPSTASNAKPLMAGDLQRLFLAAQSGDASLL